MCLRFKGGSSSFSTDCSSSSSASTSSYPKTAICRWSFIHAVRASSDSDEIPHELIGIYEAAAATCEGLDWTVLAAIHKVETGFGTGRATSSAGAQGPMQFMPSTFESYGVDGDGDHVARINDVEDAIFSAANLLCANGAGDPARLATAIWNYNHSQKYVNGGSDTRLELRRHLGAGRSGVCGGARSPRQPPSCAHTQRESGPAGGDRRSTIGVTTRMGGRATHNQHHRLQDGP